MANNWDAKPPVPSPSLSFIRSSWATTKVENTNPAKSDLPSESSTSPMTANAKGKKFIVPNWAKTQTATVPGLSEETAAKFEAAEAEKVAQMKMDKVRSAAARKRTDGDGRRESRQVLGDWEKLGWSLGSETFSRV